MKALTICQPYAELIACGEKRVENRTWPTSYRGPLLIHAGKGRKMLEPEFTKDGHEVDRPTGIFLSTMDFGAVIATAELIDCLPVDPILRGAHDEQYPWLRAHKHVNGPWCWVLDKVRRLYSPIPYKGALGLFEVDLSAQIDEDEASRQANEAARARALRVRLGLS
jgi:activating signal cointegrator 1